MQRASKVIRPPAVERTAVGLPRRTARPQPRAAARTPQALPDLLLDGVRIPVELVRSRRTSIALQVRAPGTVLVRAPSRMPRADIDRFVEEHRTWIARQLRAVEERAARTAAAERLTPDELAALDRRAHAVIPARVAHFAPIVGVAYGRIAIRTQKTRWGSCSAKGNLNFNRLLMLAPSEVLDYVVVHELCHRLEMNHSPRFWAEVERVLPDYREQRRWLKQHGPELMARIQQ